MKLKKTIAALATAVLVTGVGAMSAAAATAPADIIESTVAATQQAASDPNDVGILATDAPRAIRIGAAVTPLRVTVQTGQPMERLGLVVFDGDGNAVGYGEADSTVAGRPNVFKADTEIYAEDLEFWGAHFFAFYADRPLTDDLYASSTSYDTELRAHSMLGLRASTSGSTTTVQGSARAYNTLQDRYAAWSGRPVSLQRWTGSTWVQVAGVSTDARGNFTTSVRVPAGSQLRAVVRDVPAIWGAVSATAKA